MMTHRSKKPFECKFEGCDKSYCDARSLRRHLENHHQQSAEAGTASQFPASETPAEHFRFDIQARANTAAAWHGDPQKSPGYLQQVSPISPAPGQAPTSPLDCPRPGWNQPFLK